MENMITELGHFCLILTFALNVVAYLTCYKKSFGSVRTVFLTYWARGQSLLLLLSFFCLMLAFLRSDFSVAAVAQHSHSTTPWIYKMAATWGHHEGSMLLWCLILSFYVTLFAQNLQKIPSMPYQQTLQKLQGVMLLFLSYSIFYANPFERLMPFPINKGELNPLLQDISITFHPILLYLGFLGFVIPFAIGLSTLWAPISGTPFIRWTKPWVALSMGFLSLGIVSGSWWAYYELGWGGWWFWDPVESASLLPWLSGAALLHLYRYNAEAPTVQRSTLFFSCFCFLLSLASVWVIRGGMVISVHSFALAPERSMMLFIIFLIYFIATFMAFFKLPKTSAQPFSLLTSAVIFLSYLLFIVGWGLFFPVVFQAITTQPFSFDSAYFTKLFCYPSLGALLLMALTPFVQKKRKVIPNRLVNKLPFYGAHLGIGILALGISINQFSQKEEMETLSVGKSMMIEDIEITLEKIQPLPARNYLAYQGTVSLKKGGVLLGSLYPERRLYFATQTEHSEARILRRGLTTLSVALGETTDQKSWVVRAYSNPFIILIWMGGALVGLSILLIFFRRREDA